MAGPAIASDPVQAKREFAERTRALYQQAVASGWGSVVVSLCLVAVMRHLVPTATLLAWLGVTWAMIACRLPLLRGFAQDKRRDEHCEQWARRYTMLVSAIGVCWGLAPFLMLRPDDPFAVASFLMVLALICAGNIASQSYHPPAVHAFLSLALLPTALRLALFGEQRYMPIALTVVLFYLFLLAYARVQSRQLLEAIRLKHENLSLIEALRSEKEQAEMLRASAEQANLAKSQFLAAASHDLRQPLHALGLFSAALHEMASEPDKRRVVQNIFASIDALEALFSELLDLSRLDAGALRPKLRHASLDQSLEGLRAQYAPLAEDKGLVLSVKSDPAAVVYTDPLLLEQLLGNLISNAIQYTQYGSVSVSVSSTPQELVLEVRDTGEGIPEEHRERVFDELFQIGNPERDRRKGLGLGLAIVRRISSILDHPVSLVSEVGAGSSFSVRVPRGDAARVESEKDAPATGGDLLSGKAVLVIEDEVSVASGMQELLARWGCEVLLAADAREAVHAARARQPDVIVADLRLRLGANGVDAIASVRVALGTTVPALIITGDTAVDALKLAQLRDCPVLHKPVRPVKLRAALSQLLSVHV